MIRLTIKLSPSVIGFGYIPIELVTIGNNIDIIIRNKPVKATVVKKKFYRRGE